MEAIKLRQFITGNDLIIHENDLQMFKNQMVEVIILPRETENSKHNDFMKYAGTLSDNDADLLLTATKDCRNIDKEEWL